MLQHVGGLLMALCQTFQSADIHLPGVPATVKSAIVGLSQSLVASCLPQDAHRSWSLGGLALVYSHASPLISSLAYRVALLACTLSPTIDADTVAVICVNDIRFDAYGPPIVLEEPTSGLTKRWYTAFDRHLASMPSVLNLIKRGSNEIAKLQQLLEAAHSELPAEQVRLYGTSKLTSLHPTPFLHSQ